VGNAAPGPPAAATVRALRAQCGCTLYAAALPFAPWVPHTALRLQWVYLMSCCERRRGRVAVVAARTLQPGVCVWEA